MTRSKYRLCYDNETSAHLTALYLPKKSSELSLPVITCEFIKSIDSFTAEHLISMPCS